MPRGESSRAAVAGASSPEAPATPVPATVEIVPDGFTLRMAWLAVSAIKRLPAESVAQALGVFSCAKRAAPSSPAPPLDPLPAAVWPGLMLLGGLAGWKRRQEKK